MVDLTGGRVVYLIVTPVGGQPADCYALPPMLALPDAANRQTLVFQFDRTRFAAGPHFSEKFASDANLPPLALAVRQYYGLADGQGTVTNSTGTMAAVASPAPGVKSLPDRELSRKVLFEMTCDSEGGGAFSIVVTAVNGKVTVKGKVRNEKEARRILAAAERVAGAGNVQDQLEYRGRKPA
jgi:hypothetical protein